VLGAELRWHAAPWILVVVGQRLLPLPIRPAVAFDLDADAAVTAQLAQRQAVAAQAVIGRRRACG
jgi:hypothetical protein